MTEDRAWSMRRAKSEQGWESGGWILCRGSNWVVAIEPNNFDTDGEAEATAAVIAKAFGCDMPD